MNLRSNRGGTKTLLTEHPFSAIPPSRVAMFDSVALPGVKFTVNCSVGCIDDGGGGGTAAVETVAEAAAPRESAALAASSLR